MEPDFKALAEEAYQNPGNYVAAGEAISADLAGLRIYDAPIFAVGDASDPMFEGLRRPEAVGPQFRLPGEWLPDAKRVVSFFLPFSREIKRSNETQRSEPSPQWLHGRIEGQRFLMNFARRLCDALEAAGEKALIPVAQKEFAAWSAGAGAGAFRSRHGVYQQLVGAPRSLYLRPGHLQPEQIHDHRKGVLRTIRQRCDHRRAAGDRAAVHGALRVLYVLRSLRAKLPGKRHQS